MGRYIMNNINFDKTPDNILFSISILINNSISEIYLFNHDYYRIWLPKDIKLFDLHNIVNEFNNLHKKFRIEFQEDEYHYILIINKIK